jgi:hypothetical protein
MRARFRLLALPAGALIFFSSCKDVATQSHGPIKLGDSSTIVTENNPQKLQDLVTDLQPDIPPSVEEKDTAEEVKPVVADTDKKNKAAATLPARTASTAPGMTAGFENVTVSVPNVVAKQTGNKNLLHASGAVFTYVSGNINGNTLSVTGNVTKVSQRYQVATILKNNMGTLAIDALSSTSDWEPMVGGNNLYRISGLDTKSLEAPDGNAAGIRRAVEKAAQRHRYSRRKVAEWVSSVHNVRATNQKPLYIVLRSVMWKIEGKDAKGRAFTKQVRMDMPF